MRYFISKNRKPLEEWGLASFGWIMSMLPFFLMAFLDYKENMEREY